MKIRVKVRIGHQESDGAWDEEITVDVNGTLEVEEAVQNVVELFNEEELRRKVQCPDYVPSLRRLISIYAGSVSVNVHDWRKKNLVTISKNGQMYDLMECVNCGKTYKRFRLDDVGPRELCKKQPPQKKEG